MKQIFYYGILVFFSIACSSKPGKFKVTGKLDQSQGEKIVLEEMTNTSPVIIDSSRLTKTGKFSLKGNTQSPKFYSLNIAGKGSITLLIKPHEKIHVTADIHSFSNNYTVEGSDDNKLIKEVNVQLNKTITLLDSIGNLYRSELKEEGRNIDSLRKVTYESYQKYLEEHKTFTHEFIQEHPSSFASYMALFQQLGPRTFVLNSDEDLTYFTMVHDNLFKQYPKSPYLRVLKNIIDKTEEKMKAQGLQKMINEAKEVTVPEIALPTPKGDTILLSSLKGKVVLLDFWASWCPPCRDENPNLVNVYKQYHTRGFEIYQVSLDRSKDAWVKAIEKDNLSPWIHVSDLKFWNSIAARTYNVTSIPANFLIDKNGNIIDRNLRGERLGQKLDELFKN